MKLSKLKSDPSKTTGRKFEFATGVSLLIAKWGNPRHMAALERLAMERSEKGMANNESALSRDERVAASEGVLVGWDGIEDDDGNRVAYSQEKAQEILTDPDMWEVWQFVRMKSTGGFKAAEEQIQGN